jgi:hypothetical protein
MIFKGTHRTTGHPVSAKSQEALDAAMRDHEAYLLSPMWVNRG